MNINTLDKFHKILYEHIAGIFRDVSNLPDTFFDLLIDYSKNKKYESFDDDNIEFTIEAIYIDYVKYIIDNSENTNKYSNIIDNFILNYPDDLSSLCSSGLAMFAMVFDDEQINAVMKIKEIVHNFIQDNPTKIVDYLQNNIDKYL